MDFLQRRRVVRVAWQRIVNFNVGSVFLNVISLTCVARRLGLARRQRALEERALLVAEMRKRFDVIDLGQDVAARAPAKRLEFEFGKRRRGRHHFLVKRLAAQALVVVVAEEIVDDQLVVLLLFHTIFNQLRASCARENKCLHFILVNFNFGSEIKSWDFFPKLLRKAHIMSGSCSANMLSGFFGAGISHGEIFESTDRQQLPDPDALTIFLLPDAICIMQSVTFFPNHIVNSTFRRRQCQLSLFRHSPLA